MVCAAGWLVVRAEAWARRTLRLAAEVVECIGPNSDAEYAMMRKYKRDRRGRFARTGGSGRAARRGALIGGALLLGGPAYVPIGAAVGAGVGYGLSRARRARKSR